MRARDAIARAIYIITEYYENTLEPFFDAVADDVLWIGPAEGQLIQGKDILLSMFAAERHTLTFTMGAIQAHCVAPSAHVKETVLRLGIATHYPSGATDVRSAWIAR